jgi:spore coat polysaccharide biosynthesis protein SpsF
MKRRLVAALACRNDSARLYGKPLQNLDTERRVRILDNLIGCVRSLPAIDEIVLGISDGPHNAVFRHVADELGLRYIIGDPIDVLSRLIQCGQLAGATDIFRATTESPFLYIEPAERMWARHCTEGADATFLDGIIDGCGFQMLRLSALVKSHDLGNARHRSELCSLYIREHAAAFRIITEYPPEPLRRPDLRLTVDTPEDLTLCRAVYARYRDAAPVIPLIDAVSLIESLQGTT